MGIRPINYRRWNLNSYIFAHETSMLILILIRTDTDTDTDTDIGTDTDTHNWWYISMKNVLVSESIPLNEKKSRRYFFAFCPEIVLKECLLMIWGLTYLCIPPIRSFHWYFWNRLRLMKEKYHRTKHHGNPSRYWLFTDGIFLKISLWQWMIAEKWFCQIYL